MPGKIYTKEQELTITLLKKARLQSNLTQSDVAHLLGVTQSYVSKVESGQTRIDIISLREFAKIYKKHVGWFLE